MYAGPGDDEAEHQRTGGYRDGDQVPALSVASGRPVVSDPSAGEAARHSDLWIRLDGTPGTVQFAALVYGELDVGTSSLPPCRS